MPTCPKHPDNYFKPGGFCKPCNDELIAEVKAADKEKKVQAKLAYKRKYSGSKRNNLKNRLQSAVAKKFKAQFKGTPLYRCWITDKVPTGSGLFSLHCSHFYPKSEIWQLWDHPHNLYLSVYSENVNKQSNVTSARGMMEKVYSKAAMEELDKLAAYYLDAMKKGKERRTPTDLQLMAMIERNK